MRAGNLRFIIEVPNISLPHLEAWSHIKAWSEKITFEIEAPASIRYSAFSERHAWSAIDCAENSEPFLSAKAFPYWTPSRSEL